MGLDTYLLQFGIKPSVQRLAIMEYLQNHKTHPTADEIYNALFPAIPTLSKTTVYNTLKLFSEKGAALCLSIEGKNSRFDGDISNHAHFICNNCGCINDIPISEDQVSALSVTAEKMNISEIHVYYKGLCESCSKKTKNQSL